MPFGLALLWCRAQDATHRHYLQHMMEIDRAYLERGGDPEWHTFKESHEWAMDELTALEAGDDRP